MTERNLYLDITTHDLTLTDSKNLRLTTTQAEWLSQKLENRLKTYIGEWFANETIGFPYFSKVLKKNPDIEEVNTLLKNYIKDTRGVDELISFDTDFDASTRFYQVDFIVKTTEGETAEGSFIL